MCDRREKDILAGSVVVLPASPIGLSEKVGKKERETGIEKEGEREKQRGNSCGLAHCTKRGVACRVFRMLDGEKQALSKESGLRSFAITLCLVFTLLL